MKNHLKTTKDKSRGKVIISGEHSVVYGVPALVGGIELFREVEVSINESQIEKNNSALINNILQIFESKTGFKTANLKVKESGSLPIGSGLGSSAAVAHALFKALYKMFKLKITKKDLYNLVQESEKFAHGNPSGVDAIAVVYGGLIEFIKDLNSGEVQIKKIKLDEDLKSKLNFFLIDSGKPQETTKQMVEMVAKNLKNNHELNDFIKQMGEVTTQLVEGIKRGQFKQELIKENQNLLDKLGVVGKKAEQMIKEIENDYGVAKITGAGGIKDGSGMVLVYSKDHDRILALIKKNNWKSYFIKVG